MKHTIDAGTLAGSWRLKSVTEHHGHGEASRNAYGSEASGMISYSPDGFMSVVIRGRREGRPLTIAYAGRYSTGAGVLTHLVHVGIPPFDSDQRRYAELIDADTLRLSTAPLDQARFELTWQRVANGAPTRPEVWAVAWKALDAEVARRLAESSDGERTVFSAGVAQRLLRAHEALPLRAQRSFTLSLRPLLSAVWAGALGDTSAFGAVKSGLGTFYLSEYCHNDGTDGPDDAREPAAAAILHAARAYLHGCTDFALFTSGEALEAAPRLPGDEGGYAEDPDEFRAEELRRQLRDLDRITAYATDLRGARFGLASSRTARLRTELQDPLSRPDDLTP
ncbi:lipocalin-like domain-containing protein [Actinacidiphila rubida]|uniref:Lipocalin-like domain-containing protein n=1 Tax=Actinacidiphila rubida TaxID=310780 RepID=A0A1H8PXN9_9ACTN|nr:lipocalin-like domain-containing protein [Actinacidiphila rubida]SEO46313.1 Lipocalin-like domain-containing protein [Actinacidiphila rubida]